MDQMMIEYLMNIQERLFKKSQKAQDQYSDIKSLTKKNEEQLKQLSDQLVSLKSDRDLLKTKIGDF